MCEKQLLLLASSYLWARPSVYVERLSSKWMNFHEIWYLNIFRNSVKKKQFSVKLDKNNGYFTRRLIYTFDFISFSSS
jgi:hypothetical protein